MNKVVAWRWTLNMEDGQNLIKLSEKKKNPFGKRGENYSPEYWVTSTPLYAIPDTRCVVPREVTSAIVVDICARFGIGPTRVGEIYRAMLNAAEVGDGV